MICEGLRRFAKRAPAGIEIAAGEYAYTVDYVRTMLEAGAVDVQQADMTRCGGVTGFPADRCLVRGLSHRPFRPLRAGAASACRLRRRRGCATRMVSRPRPNRAYAVRRRAASRATARSRPTCRGPGNGLDVQAAGCGALRGVGDDDEAASEANPRFVLARSGGVGLALASAALARSAYSPTARMRRSDSRRLASDPRDAATVQRGAAAQSRGRHARRCRCWPTARVEHYRGSFKNKAMYTPLIVSALTLATSIHGTADMRPVAHIACGTQPICSRPPRASSAPAFTSTMLARRSGGFSWQNLFYGAPLGAPMAILLSGLLGFCSERVRESEPRHAPAIFGLPAGTSDGGGHQRADCLARPARPACCTSAAPFTTRSCCCR